MRGSLAQPWEILQGSNVRTHAWKAKPLKDSSIVSVHMFHLNVPSGLWLQATALNASSTSVFDSTQF